MKSLAAWSSSRASTLELVEVRLETHGMDGIEEFHQLIGRVAETLSASIVEARSLTLQRNQSRAIRDWAKQQGQALESAFERSVSSIRQRIVGSVSEALMPLLGKHIEQKSLEDFLAVIDTERRDAPLAPIEVTVPARLADLVTGELKKRNVVVVVTEEADDELVTHLGEARIESRIGPSILKAQEILSHAG